MYVEVIANGDTIALTQDLMLQTEYGTGAIGINVGAASGYALGLRFVIDNSLGAGAVTVNSGTFVVPAGAIQQATVVPDGGGKKYELRVPVWLGLSKENEIQFALNNAKATDRTIELAGGDIQITQTLTAPFVVGNGIRGKGATESIAYDHPLQGVASSLVWNGNRDPLLTTATTAWTGVSTNSARPTNTLLHYTGGDMSLEQLSFDGAYRSQINPPPVAKCPLGILINRTSGGIGSGKIHARKLMFEYFITAIQVGVELYEHSCDESAWYDVCFSRCDTGMKTVNLQGMGHTFYNLRIGGTNVAFDFSAGGDLTCYRTFVGSTTTLLKFNNNTPSGFGNNTGKYHFYGIKVDAQGNESKLVDMALGGYDADIVFDGLHIGHNLPIPTAHMFNISNSTSLRVDNSRGLRPGVFRWNTTTNQSLIVVENTRVGFGLTSPDQLFDVTNSNGSCRCIVRNCLLDGTNTILNYDAVLTG
jgi:hypothetical protein